MVGRGQGRHSELMDPGQWAQQAGRAAQQRSLMQCCCVQGRPRPPGSPAGCRRCCQSVTSASSVLECCAARPGWKATMQLAAVGSGSLPGR